MNVIVFIRLVLKIPVCERLACLKSTNLSFALSLKVYYLRQPINFLFLFESKVVHFIHVEYCQQANSKPSNRVGVQLFTYSPALPGPHLNISYVEAPSISVLHPQYSFHVQCLIECINLICSLITENACNEVFEIFLNGHRKTSGRDFWFGGGGIRLRTHFAGHQVLPRATETRFLNSDLIWDYDSRKIFLQRRKFSVSLSGIGIGTMIGTKLILFRKLKFFQTLPLHWCFSYWLSSENISHGPFMLHNEARRKPDVTEILLVKNFAGTGIRTHNILTKSFLHHSHILLQA